MKHSKSSIFLMEIILNMFFFAILITICLQIFLKANTLSKNSVILQQAVTCCSSIAEIFQSSEDGCNTLLTLYPDATNLDDSILIYYDQNYQECHQSEAVYHVTVTYSISGIPSAEIYFYQIDANNALYSLTVSSYTPQQLSSLSGGDSNE